MKLTSTKGELILNKQPDKRLTHFRSEWYRKWNRIGALVTCTLMFLLLLGIVFESMWHDWHENKNTNSTYFDNTYSSSNFYLVGSPACSVTLIEDNKKCQILCEHVAVQFINDFLQNASNLINCEDTKYISLNIQRSKLGDLQFGWLKPPVDYIINELIFGTYGATTSIDTIYENAFGGEIYHYTKNIMFISASINIIKKFSFNTPNLIQLIFRQSLVKLIEENFAQDMNSLQILEVLFTEDTTNNSERLINLTKSTRYPNLVTLDMRYTHWNYLKLSMFKSMKNLRVLYATQAQIDTIEKNTFKKNEMLKKINLDNIGLEVLPDDVFGFTIISDVQLEVQDNDWNCNCSLQWLKEAWLASKRINEPKCAQPSKHEGKSFRDVDFCFDETVTYTVTNTEKDSTSTTIQWRPVPAFKIALTCLNGGKITLGHSRKSKMKPPVNFQVQEINQGEIQLIMEKFIEDYSVLWTNNIRDLEFTDDHVTHDRRNQTGCLTNIDQMPILPRLLPKNSYIICLIHKLETLISPFSCKAITTKALFEEQAWIKNKDKMYFSIGASITLIVLLCCGIVIGMFIRQKFPNNQNYKREKKIMPSRIHVEQDEPMAKKENIYEEIDTSESSYNFEKDTHAKVNYFRSHSEGSLNNYSGFPSSYYGYAIPRVPTQFEILSWKMERMKEKHLMSEKAPPLPPHP